jgi:hypothetical protein
MLQLPGRYGKRGKNSVDTKVNLCILVSNCSGCRPERVATCDKQGVFLLQVTPRVLQFWVPAHRNLNQNLRVLERGDGTGFKGDDSHPTSLKVA